MQASSDDRAVASDRLDPAPPGFRSAAGKHRVSRIVWMFGIACAFVQLAVPLIGVIAALPGLQIMEVRRIDPERGAWWQDALWLIEQETKVADPDSSRCRLLRWDGGDDPELVELAEFDATDPRLLTTPERLWVASPDGVGSLSAGGLEFERPRVRLAAAALPFLLDGAPALLEDRGADGVYLHRFADGDWRDEGPFDLGLDLGYHAFELYAGPDGPVTLALLDGSVSIAERFPPCLGGCADAFAEVLEPDASAPIAAATAATVDGALWVFVQQEADDGAGIRGLRRGAAGWEQQLEIARWFPGAIGVYPRGQRGRYLIGAEGLPGSLTVFDVRDGAVAREVRLGADPFVQTVNRWSLAAQLAGAALVILLGLIVSAPLRRHKLDVHRHAQRSARYASLIRRGVAGLIDGLILGGPLIAGSLMLVLSFSDLEASGLEGMLGGMGLYGGGFVWAGAWFLILSFLEGRAGISPGNWIAGIRVAGLDLEPCGFGRALLRNAVMLVDSMFEFLVALMLIALTRRWQRLGDLAARTVVIEVRRPDARLDG